MRFSFRINFKENKLHVLPGNYRINLLSLIKQAIYEGDKNLYQEFYNEKCLIKPYTFSCLFPGGQHKKNEFGKSQLHFFGKYFKIFFSTGDIKFKNTFLKGLKILNNKYSPFKMPVFFTDLQENDAPYILDNHVRFYLASPLVLRKLGARKHQGFITYKDEGFEKALKANVNNLSRIYLNEEFECNFNFEKCKIIKVTAYSVMPVTQGAFFAEGNNLLLNMIQDYGIGLKRSQGFGMVL
jgi:CRISPR-associated endoribonuclease Cas6